MKILTGGKWVRFSGAQTLPACHSVCSQNTICTYFSLVKYKTTEKLGVSTRPEENAAEERGGAVWVGVGAGVVGGHREAASANGLE